MLELKAKIRVTKKYQGTSKFSFWTDLEVGDELLITTPVERIGRGRSLYATTLTVNNITQEKEFSDSTTGVSTYLSKIEFEECNLQ